MARGDTETQVGTESVWYAREEREMTAAERSKAELLKLGESFRILLAKDLDRTHKPWLTTEDGEVWIAEGGEPAGGFSPTAHAIVVEPSGEWGFVTQTSASGRENFPRSAAELEARARRQEKAIADGRRAQETAKRMLLKAPPPRVITAADLEPRLGRGPVTVRSLVERLQASGAVAVVEAGRLYVHVSTFDEHVLRLAAALYAVETEVISAVGGKAGVVDPAKLPAQEFTPSGALLGRKHLGRAA
jgi:hypothetical protein